MNERTQLIRHDGDVAIQTRPKRQNRSYTYYLVHLDDCWAWRDQPTWHVLAFARAHLDEEVTGRVIGAGQTRLDDYSEMPFPAGSDGGLASTSAD